MGTIMSCRPHLKPPCHVFDGNELKCLCGALDAFNRRVVQPSPRYTLDDIKGLAREFTDTRVAPEPMLISQRLLLSTFLAWLARREQGKESE